MIRLLAMGAAGCDAAEVPAGSILSALDEAGASVMLRIDGVRPDPVDPTGVALLYSVSTQAPSGDWRPYCSADAYGGREAVALPGSWNERGERTSEDAVTFGCTSGAIGKCARFGYAPWRSLDGRSLADHHAACVRMVRADYCGDGRAHTVDGTWIDVWDRIGVQIPERDRPVVLEAGWSPEGATFVNVARWSDDLAALVAECPERLVGRAATDGVPLTEAQIVERFPETLLLVEHALLPEDKKRIPPAGPSAPRR